MDQVRGGAYVCQCPPGGSVAVEQRQATELYRDKLAGLAVDMAANSTSSALEQLALELDDQLGDRNLVASSLLSQQQRHQFSRDMVPNQTSGGNLVGRYFALGAQLDSDAALDWLTDSIHRNEKPPIWPDQICRLCRPVSTKRPETIGLDELSSSDNQSTASQQHQYPHEEFSVSSSFTCYDFRSTSAFDWIRPLVVTLQSICLLITLLLVAILLRIRKSRVSDLCCLLLSILLSYTINYEC